MNTCKNCKHWWTEHRSQHPRNFGVCQSGCVENYILLDKLYPMSSEITDSMAEVEGQLETGPNFGCVHFEKKSMLHKNIIDDDAWDNIIKLSPEEIQNIIKNNKKYFEMLQNMPVQKIKKTWHMKWFDFLCTVCFYLKKDIPYKWQIYAIGGVVKTYTIPESRVLFTDHTD